MMQLIRSFFYVVAGIVILPYSIACLYAFYKHIEDVKQIVHVNMLWGGTGFVVVFLFLYQFWGVYEFGQHICSAIFKFMTPFDRVMARFIPFYVSFFCVLRYIMINFLEIGRLDGFFTFAIGFSIMMHVMLVAQELQNEERTIIKPAYFFWMPVNIIVNCFYVVMALDVAYKAWTLPIFFQSTLVVGRYWYVLAFGKIIPL